MVTYRLIFPQYRQTSKSQISEQWNCAENYIFILDFRYSTQTETLSERANILHGGITGIVR